MLRASSMKKAKQLLLDTLERFNDWHTDYSELSEAEIRNIESVLTQNRMRNCCARLDAATRP